MAGFVVLAWDTGIVALLRYTTHSPPAIVVLQPHAGCIPSELCQLGTLTWVNLSFNHLTGEGYALVPMCLGLEILDNEHVLAYMYPVLSLCAGSACIPVYRTTG